jgi:hypothetical protein
MKKLLFIIALIGCLTGKSQQFSIRKVELSADKIFVYYDLLDTVSNHSYTISLFSSKDNFISPLQKVKGDVGLEVKPGANKKIEWSAKEELGPDYKSGNISLEVKGRLYIPFIRLDGDYESFKRSKKYEITWTGGTQQNILNSDLYQGTKKITSFPNIANVGHYTLVIPNSVKPGKDFRFRISDTKNKDQIVNTKEFSIDRRVPLVYKIIPPIIIGVGAYLFVKSNQPQPMDEPPTPDGLDGN